MPMDLFWILLAVIVSPFLLVQLAPQPPERDRKSGF